MSDEDREYKTEYAKSSRSVCNKCGLRIMKGILRIAKMIQSPHFDGKQPNWYHSECFFKDWVVNDISDVAGFTSLRWKDQEKIRKNVVEKVEGSTITSEDGAGHTAKEEGASCVAKEEGASCVAKKDKASTSEEKEKKKKKKKKKEKKERNEEEERKKPRNDLVVEYARSKMSTCRECGSKIPRNAIRIAKLVEIKVGVEEDIDTHLTYWHHLDCILPYLHEEGVAPEQIINFTGLGNDGMRVLQEECRAFAEKAESKKRNRSSEVQPPAVKKMKMSQEELMALKEQSELIWKYRDDLKKLLRKAEWHSLLKANRQSIPKGDDAILDLLADGMAFGALDKCPTCGGQLTISSHSYQCHGNISEWSKCTYSTDDPARCKWKVPEELKWHRFLKMYKFKSGRRLFPKDSAPTQSMDVTDGPGPSQSVTPSVSGASQLMSQPVGGASQLILHPVGGTPQVVSQPLGGASQLMIHPIGGTPQVVSQLLGGASQLMISQPLGGASQLMSQSGQFSSLSKGKTLKDLSQLRGGFSPGREIDGPLKDFTIYMVGQELESISDLTITIESLGGRVVTEVTADTTICISNEDSVHTLGERMQHVKDCNVPVVKEEYLKAAALGNALLKIPKFNISSWGKVRHSASLDNVGGIGDESMYKSDGPTTMTVEWARAAVDPACPLAFTHHVLDEDGTIWNAVLGQVDIVKGTNSYYKLQLLERDSGQDYCVFRSWGRVGTTIGGVKTQRFRSFLSKAKRSFRSLYRDKTGNEWGEKGEKVFGKFYPLDIDYGCDEDKAFEIESEGGPSSKLAPEIQQLVQMLFDIKRMKTAMSEFEIDLKKMPLGKLSKRQLRDAYKVLSELLKEIQGDKNPAKIMDASNRFYTLIPHDFGMKKPPPLNTEEVIQLKTMMVDNLLEIELAYSLLKEKRESFENPIDVHYKKLKTNMEVLPKDSEEFGRLVEYVKNTHGETHSMYELEVLEVFKVDRHGEGDRFKSFSSMHNRQLLWHGSRTTNFCGILSQGLRIAPPEAPVTGYMFGKGVYFADMVSKSANYCRVSRNDNVGLMLLCEVALGDMYELKDSEYVETLPPGKHSTKGLGGSFPDPAGNYTTEEGVVIPMGRATSNLLPLNRSLYYNEYIVYDVKQIHMRYLLKMNFKFKSYS